MYHFTTKLEPFARGFLSEESDSKIKKIGAGLVSWAKECDIELRKDLGFAFTTFDGMASGLTFSESVYCENDVIDEEIEKHPEDKDDLEYIKKEMAPQTVHSNDLLSLIPPRLLEYSAYGYASAIGWMGHAVPDFANIATLGTDYYREKIEKYRAINADCDDFYDGLLLTLDALDILGGRIRDKADEAICKIEDSDERRRLTILRDTFDHAPKMPCRDFAEAVIVFNWLFVFDGSDSPGHFDQYMYDLWKITDSSLRREYLENLWISFHEVRAWNLCISGTDENWNDLTNDLTYEILDVAAKFKFNTPNLTVRLHKNSPEKLLRAAYKSLATGSGLPGLYNDEAVVPAMERLGIPTDDAHRYVMNGCNQIDIQGKSHMGLEDGSILLPLSIHLALHDGRMPKYNKQMGLRTGNPSDFKTFDEFYAAVLAQLDDMVKIVCEMSNTVQEIYAKEAPNPFRSILIEGCIEKGLDYKNRGPIYGHGQIRGEGIADSADSLAAIKKFVYDEKRYTMEELVDALDKDFEGYDEIYRTLRNSECRYGNDIDYVDSIAADFANHYNSELLKYETFRGGYFSGGSSPFNSIPGYGLRLDAMPNGTKKDEALFADSIGATPGFDTHGPTALINSCSKLDHTLPGSGFILNLKFDRDIFNTKEGEEGFIALTRSYFARGGQMLTYTVVSQDELLDAKIHPENHRDLIVRVGGYSGYFIELNEKIQENVIARSSLKIT